MDVSHPVETGLVEIPFYALELRPRRLLRMPPSWVDRHYTPKRAADTFRQHLGYPADTHFMALWLNTRDEITGGAWIAHDGHHFDPHGPRDPILTAYTAGVSHVVLVHSHPTGSTRPTDEDLRLTRHLVDWGRQLGIRVRDHLILSNHHLHPFSFVAKHLIRTPILLVCLFTLGCLLGSTSTLMQDDGPPLLPAVEVCEELDEHATEPDAPVH